MILVFKEVYISIFNCLSVSPSFLALLTKKTIHYISLFLLEKVS